MKERRATCLIEALDATVQGVGAVVDGSVVLDAVDLVDALGNTVAVSVEVREKETTHAFQRWRRNSCSRRADGRWSRSSG